MPCSIHIAIETAADCAACYNSWPESEKRKYRRVQCKRHNWRGKVDTMHINPDNMPIKELQ